MNFEYVLELFREMRKLLPGTLPSLQLRGDDLELSMKHPLDDWHSWILTVDEGNVPPAILAKNLYDLLPDCAKKRTGAKP